MTHSVDFTGKPFHFIGVGGIGMSALAYVLADRHLPVSGSDLKFTNITDRLEQLGVRVFYEQKESNLSHFKAATELRNATQEPLQELGCGGIATLVSTAVQSVTEVLPETLHPAKIAALSAPMLPQVICSTAIHPDNPEYRAALELGCPIFHRSDVLAALIQDYQSIAVAGTHGKTTTSGMISYVLERSGLDPTVVIGGEVAALGGNARSGRGAYLVAEADESDGSLVKFHPYIGVITNLELDHLDHYANLDQLVDTLQTFASHCEAVVGCLDCETVRTHMPLTLSYSLNPEFGADYTVDEVVYRGDGTQARVWERGQVLGELSVALLGSHNLANALAAVAVGRHLGLRFETIALAIATYEGARRRFEYRGTAKGIVFVDDYAHHPSEILATLKAARLQVTTGKTRLPVLPKRVVAIFQPHRYSRTQALLQDFATCFGDADEILICEVYSAGERNTAGVNGQTLAEAVANHQSAHHGTNVHYCPTMDDVNAWLRANLQPQDLALFLGAGNLNQIIPALVDSFHATEP